jgi:hypothetical protein
MATEDSPVNYARIGATPQHEIFADTSLVPLGPASPDQLREALDEAKDCEPPNYMTAAVIAGVALKGTVEARDSNTAAGFVALYMDVMSFVRQAT